jgi:SAM-dependent methyltransferase
MTEPRHRATDIPPAPECAPAVDPLAPGVELPVPAPSLTAENDEDAPDIVSSAPRYALRFSGRAGAYLLSRQSDGISRLLRHANGDIRSVLDVGGGHMQVASLLAPRGYRVAVHGSTAACLFRLPELARAHPGRLDARIGPLWELPAADGEFDLVVAIRMLGHVRRWKELLAELCRASSRYVLIEFAAASGAQRLSRALFGLKRQVEGDTRRFSTYTVDEVSAELARLGFRVVAVDRQFVLPIVVHRMLRQPVVSRAIERALAMAGLARVGSPVLLLAERAASTVRR